MKYPTFCTGTNKANEESGINGTLKLFVKMNYNQFNI